MCGRSGLLSRNDLYYDEKDREELASWAEFPREVELTRRHEMVVREQLREELLESNRSTDPVGSLLLPAVQSPRRSRLVRRVGDFSDGEVEKDRAVGLKENDAKVRGDSGLAQWKRGRRRVITSPKSRDKAEVSEKGMFDVPSTTGLSSQAVLGRRRVHVPEIPMAARGTRRVRSRGCKSLGSQERLGESSEDEGSIMTLQTGENILQGASKGSERSRLQYLSQRQADLMTELSNLQRQQEEEERVVKEREEARKKEEEERIRKREAEEKREKERQQRIQEEVERRRASVTSSLAGSARRRGRVPIGVALKSQIVVSIYPLCPSATLLSIAASGGVTESAWLPLKSSIRPTVGDDIVLGRGLTAIADSIRLMHMEFFLPR